MSAEPEVVGRGFTVKRVRLGAVFGAAIVGVGLVMNAAIFVAPFDYALLGDLAYPGVFALTFLANASVIRERFKLTA